MGRLTRMGFPAQGGSARLWLCPKLALVRLRGLARGLDLDALGEAQLAFPRPVDGGFRLVERRPEAHERSRLHRAHTLQLQAAQHEPAAAPRRGLGQLHEMDADVPLVGHQLLRDLDELPHIGVVGRRQPLLPRLSCCFTGHKQAGKLTRLWEMVFTVMLLGQK